MQFSSNFLLLIMFVVAMMILHFFCFARNLSAAISVKVIPPMKYTTTVLFLCGCIFEPPPLALFMHGLPKCSPGSILMTSSIPFQPSRSIACSANLENWCFLLISLLYWKEYVLDSNKIIFFLWNFKMIYSCLVLHYVDDSNCCLSSD